MRKIRWLLILIILLLLFLSCKSVVTVKNPVYEFNQVYKDSSGSVWQQGNRINIIVGDSIQLGIKNINKEAIITPKWLVKNSNIGEIDINGIFIAKKQGETIVTGKLGDTIVKTYYITVIEPQLSILPIIPSTLPTPTYTPTPLPIVNSPTPMPEVEPLPSPAISNACPASIKIMPSSLSLCQQNPNNLRVFVRDCNGNNINNAQVIWEVINPSIARIEDLSSEDSIVEIIARDIGRTEIKANYNGISSEAQIEVRGCSESERYTKKPIKITNAATDLIDYQIKVILSDIPQNTHFWANVKDNGEDIKFFDNTTILNYWIESFNKGAKSAIIWVKIPSVPTGVKTIYLYYGKPDGISESNGNNTFEFFDDFKNALLDTNKWLTNMADGGTSLSVHDDLLDFSVLNSFDHTGGCIVSKSSIPVADYVAETKVKFTNYWQSAKGAYVGFTNSNTAFEPNYGSPLKNVIVQLWDYPFSGWWLTLTANNIGFKFGFDIITIRNIWFRMNIIYTPPTYAKATWTQLETPYEEKSLELSAAGGGISPDYVTVGIGDYITNENTYSDWVFIRKYIFPEPTIDVGAEQ